MRVDWRARQLLDSSKISRVVEMAMGKEDGADVPPSQANLRQDGAEPAHLAHKPRVDQHRFFPLQVVQQMKEAMPASYGINPVAKTCLKIV
jgi:hypothetical protein